ncbi:olfactory receptor 11A1-like [Periophthalmus magnuspinnatus]|uniref:olfactory receptor 11A1-like n=1 Tax=Periophthalmus magnuspinnatus TaxID=409849 RepID=UPI00145BCE60|nr:olfactory receptor 11A1-like [Periophthalmus magnuspinnatus]
MSNVTNFTHFMLTAYLDLGMFRYLVFLLLLVLYIMTLSSNLLLISVIVLNRTLAQPMYLFLCSLFLSELYGSTMLFPMLLHHVVWQLHQISVSFCFLQIYCLHSYATIEYLNLAVLSYDRYIAICFPLQYHSHMNRDRMIKLIVSAWLYGFFIVLTTEGITITLKLCDNKIPKVYCDNYSVVRMACSDISYVNIHGLIVTFVTIVIPFLYMLYTYVRILRVCFSGSKSLRQKALSTCMPHLVTILNFTIGGSFELVQSRFNMGGTPIAVRVFLSLYCISSQPLLSPLIYGFNISKLRSMCKGLLLSRLHQR